MSGSSSSGPPQRAAEARAQPITTLTSEEQTFHRLFPRVPPNEKLVESCQCGLTRKPVVRMGKLYVTSLRFGFQSSFMEDVVTFIWEDVLNVEKKNNFMFDAIVVTIKGNEEYSFTAFLSGGISQMFKLMKTLWAVRERYAASEAASLSRTMQSRRDSEGGSEDDESSSATNASDFSEAATSTRANSAPVQDELSASSVARDIQLTPKRLHGVPQPAGGTGDPSIVSIISLSADPITGDAKKKKPLVPLSPTTSTSPTVTPQVMEVRRLFPKLPPTETVVDSFQASCVSGVHRLGKMFITKNYILFASVMMEENMSIAFEDVEAIDKVQTMMVLDGISIRNNKGKRAITFTGFISRDAVYNTIMFFFNAVKKEEVAAAGEAEDGAVDDGPQEFKTTTSTYDLAKLPAAASLDEFSKVATDWGTALSDYSCFTKEVLAPVQLPAGRSLLEVFRVCFDDETRVLEEYHTRRKDTGQKWEPWRPTADGQPYRGQRQFTCTTLVKAMMNKACPFTEYQRYAFLDVAGSGPMLVVQFSSQISGVMFSDAFRAEALVVFSQSGADDAAQVTMRAYGYVQFLRSVWVKGKIQSKTLDDELPESYTVLAKIITEKLLKRSGKKGGGAGGADDDAVEGTEGEGSSSAASDGEPAKVVMAEKPFRPYCFFGIRPINQTEGGSGEGDKGAVNVFVLYGQLAIAGLVLLVALYGVTISFSPLGGGGGGRGKPPADGVYWTGLLKSVSGTLSAIASFVASQIMISLYLSLP